MATQDAFYTSVLSRLLKSGVLTETTTILVVCGNQADRDIMLPLGLQRVTISNLDEAVTDGSIQPYQWSRQDAENLTYPDNSFDVVLVHAGLHHCYSPHRALLEMYRVARDRVVVFEARDSVSMKIAKRLGFATDYEIEAISSWTDTGGAGAGAIPNFVYRWTENEVHKTIRSHEPRYEPEIEFFYGLRLPHYRFSRTSRPSLRMALFLIAPMARLLTAVFPHQGNEFAFVIAKGGRLHKWLRNDSGNVVVSRETVQAMGRANS